jgi:hypothetical protein
MNEGEVFRSLCRHEMIEAAAQCLVFFNLELVII